MKSGKMKRKPGIGPEKESGKTSEKKIVAVGTGAGTRM